MLCFGKGFGYQKIKQRKSDLNFKKINILQMIGQGKCHLYNWHLNNCPIKSLEKNEDQEVLFSLQTLAVPVNCGSAVEALEISTLKKLTDPCEGRVCQHKCPCGEMIYFNLESVLNNPSSSQVYHDVCVMDASKVVTFLRGGRTNAGSTQVRSGTTTHVDDTGFVYQELKSAISACGFTELENVESFGKLKEKIEREVTKTISDPVTRAITRKTFNYPPNFLLQFAIKLKDFQKVCKEKSDWKVPILT
jgi:hypothetical protein